METAIQAIWWIGLIGALIPTAVILKQAAVTVRVLRDIRHLARIIRDASAGIRANAAAGESVARAAEPAKALHEASLSLATAARALDQRLESVLKFG